MKSYTIREASKILTTSPSQIKQWEKAFRGILMIPRTKNGTRFYTEKEISLLSEVKSLYKEKKNIDEVKKSLTILINPPKEECNLPYASKETPNSLEVIEKKNIEVTNNNNDPYKIEQNIGMFLASLENYKQNLLEEVKGEIRNGIQKEVLQTIVKEIKNGSEETLYHINHSLEKSHEKTTENLESFANDLQKGQTKTTEEYQDIRGKIQKLSQITKAERKGYSKQWTSVNSTSNEIKSMIEQLSKSNEELNKSVEQLNDNDQFLMDTLRLEREQMNKEIRQREESFKELVHSFRDAAVASEKKKFWWKIW